MNANVMKTNNGKRLMVAVAVLALIACAFVAFMPASEQVNGDPVPDITVPTTENVMDSVDDFATTATGNYIISSPITLDKNVTIANGVKVYITTGGSLTVPAGYTLTVTGTLSITDGGVFTFNAGENGYNVALTETTGKISIDELEDAYRKGQLKEMFASGTAAIVSPVGELLYKGEHMIINDNKIGPVAQEMYDTIYGIQTGKIEDFMGWTVPVE